MNIYVPNIGVPQYVRQMLATIKRVIDYIMMTVGDLNIPLSSMGRLSRQKVNKETRILHVVLDQMDLTDIYRASYPKKNSRLHILFKCRWNILQD